MPLQRRLPKRGFRSRKAASWAEVRLQDLAKVTAEVIDLTALQQAKLVPQTAKYVKVIATGTLHKAVTVRGLVLSAGAHAAVTAAGGKTEE
jgi:large subunit ribosomal protein L15